MNDIIVAEDTQLLQASMFEVDDIVFKGYLDKMKDFDLIASDDLLEDALKNIRLNKITKIVYDKEQNNQDKLNNVFSAMHSSDSGLVLILKANKTHTDIYIGVNKISTSNNMSAHAANETLKAAFAGNFQGIEFDEQMYVDELRNLALEIKHYEQNYISNVLGVPSFKNDDKDGFVQGLEKVIDGLRGREYIAIIQAQPVLRQELFKAELAYQNIYNTLAVFEQKQITLSENESKTLGSSITKGITSTLAKSIGNTQTNTQGSSTSISNSKTKTEPDIKKALIQAAGGATTGAIAAGSVSGGMGAGAGALVGGIGGFVTGLFGNSSTKSNSQSSTQSTSLGTTQNETKSVAQNETSGTNESSTKGTSKSMQITEKNRIITSLLESIDKQLKRIEESKSYGMWNWGAYFISSNPLDAKLGADLYSGMLKGENSSIERNAILSWSRHEDENKFNQILNYISQLKCPVFKTPEYFYTPQILPASLISTKELVVAMGLPEKSLPSIPVMQSVQFGRNVSSHTTDKSAKKINLGSIYNLGNVDKNLKVELDINSLTAHTLVTGSTGSGKSNCIYVLLDKLNQKHKIPFLVIEPAKGEYKEIFGGRDDVSVYGTNKNFSEVLRLNPFSFHDNIHVLEHIDRLVEIFNACWPMYAAMPEVLKESIIKSYEKSGWDVDESYFAYKDKRYPTFKLLLEVLDEVIDSSKYSDEIKSNYKGALLTRVKSLNNGLVGQILNNSKGIEDAKLFDSNVIVDLSRIGSVETKSLLMGMIFLRLIEYRYSNKNTSNSNLKHITVLEEAHNILPRIATSQSSEGSNLQGKSVEMISNAIAEMRTFGEGFIVADQSPNVLDMSAIRNTGTKIILRLPETTDKNDIGKSASLNDEQIDEISRLNTGVGVVYQNNWLEAVLCSIDRFDDDKISPLVYEVSDDFVAQKRHNLSLLIKSLLDVKFEKIDSLELENLINKLNISYETQNELYSLGMSYKIELSKEKKAKIISEILEGDKILHSIKKAENMQEYDELFSSFLHQKLDIKHELETKIKDMIMYNESNSTDGFESTYLDWKKFTERIM